MSRSYYIHVRDRLREGQVAVYTSRGRTRYVYRRDGAYFRLVEQGTPYTADERRIGTQSLQAAVSENYPVEVVGRDDVHPAVRARIETGGVEAVAGEWLQDARELVELLRDGDAGRDRAKTMLAAGARLEERAEADERVELLRRREEDIGEAVGRD